MYVNDSEGDGSTVAIVTEISEVFLCIKLKFPIYFQMLQLLISGGIIWKSYPHSSTGEILDQLCLMVTSDITCER